MRNQSEGCSFKEIDSLMKMVQLGVHIPTFFLGLCLNLLAIYSFASFLRKWQEEYRATSIYMINLAVFDLLLVLSLPFKMALSQGPAHTSSFCTVAECLYFVSMYGSVFTITFISLDRYVSIKHPIWVKNIRSPRNISIVCCSVWALVCIGTIPIYQFHEEAVNSTCFHNMSDNTWGVPAIVPLEFFGFLLPMAIVCFCSFSNIHTLLGKQNELNAWAGKRAHVIHSIAASLAVFVVSFLPVHLCIFLQFLVRNGFIQDCGTKRGISFALQLALCLSNINCCLDVFCYYFVSKEFRAGIMTHQRPLRVQLSWRAQLLQQESMPISTEDTKEKL
ncbi:G-protein coupled receptor 55 isoform X2 [Vombatus ursinus]|nr:G-protein coupled receptor 55 isoform X2 [Vombatus ursinus]XP_027731119.1 G-protein coupled receptor 55 isoform X2 [Vombatus ursinus]XP_027731120.1 G-protein coupled receptor 55 isoform X2 [Vombatus ursinus]